MGLPENSESIDSANLSVMIVAGEASSDLHAANLAKSIASRIPGAEIFGMGGTALREAGVETIVDSETAASVMGFTEVIGKLGDLKKALKSLVEAAETRKPDVVVLVDFPDFNFFLARGIKKSKKFSRVPKIMHFITPTIWAWRKGRIKTVKRYIDKVAPIFPFEEKFFSDSGVQAEYVGHPFLDSEIVQPQRKDFLSQVGLPENSELVGIVPGSRKAEIELLLPVMVEAYQLLKKSHPELKALLPVAPSLKKEFIEKFIPNHSDIVLVDGSAFEVLSLSKVSLVASGTVTVEGALAKAPMVVAYKMSGVSYWIAKLLIRGLKSFAMPNILANDKFLPELLQEQVTAENLASEAEKFLVEEEYSSQVQEKLEEVHSMLHLKKEDGRGSTASERAATIALELAGVQV